LLQLELLHAKITQNESFVFLVSSASSASSASYLYATTSSEKLCSFTLNHEALRSPAATGKAFPGQ